MNRILSCPLELVAIASSECRSSPEETNFLHHSTIDHHPIVVHECLPMRVNIHLTM